MTAAIQIIEICMLPFEKKKKGAQIFMLNKLWNLSYTHTQWLQDMNNSVLHIEVFG